MYTLGGVCILTNAKLIDNLIERDNEQQSALYHQRKLLIDGIPTACLEIIQGVRIGKRIQKTKEIFIHQEFQPSDFVHVSFRL